LRVKTDKTFDCTAYYRVYKVYKSIEMSFGQGLWNFLFRKYLFI
jgi:hypothetical protein